MRVLKERQREALREVVAMGQRSSLAWRPTRAERLAAKWAFRVLCQSEDGDLEESKSLFDSLQ